MLFAENKIVENQHRRKHMEMHRKFPCAFGDVSFQRPCFRRRAYIPAKVVFLNKKIKNIVFVDTTSHSDRAGYQTQQQRLIPLALKKNSISLHSKGMVFLR